MAEIMVYIWLGIVVLSLVGEAATMDMTSIWFSVGGVVAIITWFIWNTGTGSIILQVLLFIGVSLVCICTLRKVCKNLLLRKDNEKTNASSLVGTKTKLMSDILFNQKGTLQIGDVIWACISEDGEELSAGDLVEIIKISGNKLVVKGLKASQAENIPSADDIVKEQQLLSEIEPNKQSVVNPKKIRVKKQKTSTFKDQNLL